MSRARRLLTALGGFWPVAWGLAAPLGAQREAVLKQVTLPHNYYYREMYFPQVTTGPRAVTWSPDGRELIYAMQGSLWRQRVGDSVATQLTTGPGYAHQPDWSPDGSRVVYAVYHGGAIDLRLLDLASLVSQPLVTDGAVNLDPRWAPDGRRIAYVGTGHESRFHVWLVEPGGAPVRITEDRDSGLPRYYYSRYDHYLSPTWSPDSRELILVSNRGVIWGSGGLWRMEARAGAPLRPVYQEETTWRARPDWSLDGRRVVYASYLGRQWHQLWLTTADGGDPFQLTYGEFDAVSPRWSPDGRRIAFISNASGNTTLEIIDVPGGRRIRVEPRHRVYREPMGRLVLEVRDAAGRALPARVSVTLPDGRSAAPDDAWHHADDGFDRSRRRYEAGYFHTGGTSVLTLPAGAVRVEVTHGPEYEVARASVTVPEGRSLTHRVRLGRIAHLSDSGWTSGDLHVHMNYGGHYRATPATLAFQARAEGLNVVENLIVNKEDRIPDVAYFTGQPDPASTRDLLLLHDQEFHTSFWGHTAGIGLREHLLLPDYAGYAGTAAASLFPDNATVADQVRRQGGLAGYVHPFDFDIDPADTTVALTHALPVDVALGKVDYLEAVGFSDHLATARVWYRLLNCGFRLPAGAGTDAMTNFASLRGPVGTNRVYVQAGQPLERERWYAALRAGKTLATNGPLVRIWVEGQGPGSEVAFPAGRRTVRVRVWLRSLVPVDHLELIHNGAVAVSLPLAGDRTRADTTVTLELDRSGWVLARARAEQAVDPVLDLYPFGTTSPVYLTVGDSPVRSAADAEYFLAWIDRLQAAAGAYPDWNSTAERRLVLDRIRQAREEFERRRQ